MLALSAKSSAPPLLPPFLYTPVRCAYCPERMLARLGAHSGVVMNACGERDAVIGQLFDRARHDGCGGERMRGAGHVPALVVGQDEDDVRPQRLRVRSPSIDPHLAELAQAVAQRHDVSTVPAGTPIAAAHCGPTARQHEAAAGILSHGHGAEVRQLVELLDRLGFGFRRRLALDQVEQLRADVVGDRLADALLALELIAQQAACRPRPACRAHKRGCWRRSPMCRRTPVAASPCSS